MDCSSDNVLEAARFSQDLLDLARCFVHFGFLKVSMEHLLLAKEENFASMLEQYKFEQRLHRVFLRFQGGMDFVRASHVQEVNRLAKSDFFLLQKIGVLD